LPDSTDEDTIMSVKDIVKKNDHKVVAVYVDVPGGQSQGSGFFIKDGVIVTNYHVIEAEKVQKFSFPTEITWMWKEFYTRILMLILLY